MVKCGLWEIVSNTTIRAYMQVLVDFDESIRDVSWPKLILSSEFDRAKRDSITSLDPFQKFGSMIFKQIVLI